MLAKRAKSGLTAVVVFVALLWAVHLVNTATGFFLIRLLGIVPREVEGLDGVLFAPLLHADFGHLFSNTLPLLVLGFLAFLEGARRFAVAVGASWLASGVGVWIFGGGVTIGASGLVFGLFAYLLVRGFYNRDWKQIALAVLLFLMYGSLLWGVLPQFGSNVSWQAHLFGALGGVLAALILKRRPAPSGTGRLPRQR
ncbi:rhomboid family intramembrane serine protease [uncultured Arthrobacter sp.]|uniref:rhomboid family intramembrane serine protease n=1 Tax=uncultured Arthrobacter sp. TaxID=114050 RepID=UPI002636A633|nr:rhomboid family intramembrane serine protease [uncultured Arthrobacter sp.]